jgi:nucleotide-binding universal stress UspA family protein
MKVERIVFPTDFSEGSSQALPYAVDLARHYDAKLYILHVIYDIGKAFASHVPHVSSDELHKEMNEWAMKEMDTRYIEEIKGCR